MTEAEAQGRLAAQTDRAARRAVADFVVENSGTGAEQLARLSADVRRVWEDILRTDLVHAGVCWQGPADDPRLLVVRARDGLWTFPKGHRDPEDERPSSVVRRELQEEAGVDSEVEDERLGSYRYRRLDRSEQLVRAHLARFSGVVGRGELGREPTWCAGADAADLLLQGRDESGHPGLREVVAAAVQRISAG
jgi:8-oxo-dGTP pyrophosphatase MutT (NUDIX family)